MLRKIREQLVLRAASADCRDLRHEALELDGGVVIGSINVRAQRGTGLDDEPLARRMYPLCV